MIPGGYDGPPSSSSSSSSPPRLLRRGRHVLLLLPLVRRCWPRVLQDLHRGTSPRSMSSSIAAPGTRTLQFKHEAVANEPWHCSTERTPTSVSSVSIFCV